MHLMPEELPGNIRGRCLNIMIPIEFYKNMKKRACFLAGEYFIDYSAQSSALYVALRTYVII